MSTWDERVQSHSALQRLDDLRTKVDTALDGEVDPAAQPWLLRFQRVLAVLHSRLDEIDPFLVSAAVLQGLDNHLSQVQTNVQNFLNNGNVQHLSQADPQIDAALQASAPLLVAVPWEPREVEDLREHVTNYRRSAGQLLVSLRQDADDLETKLGELRGEVQESDEKQAAKLAELEAAVASHRQSMEEALTNFRDSFSTAQEERRDQFSTLVQKQTERVSSTLDDLDEKATSLRTEWSAEAEALVDEMQEYRDQAAKLVDAVGNIGTAAGYGKYSSEQKRNADLLRMAAVAVVVVAVVFAIWALASAGADLTWQRAVAKLTVVGLLGGLAAYLGRQSGIHRDREASAKKVELELAALDPYLALMDDEKRDGVKTEIATKLFGQPLATNGQAKGEEPMPASQVVALLTEILSRTR